MQFHKADELDSLIKGIEFIAANNPNECYYYENPLNDQTCEKVIWFVFSLLFFFAFFFC